MPFNGSGTFTIVNTFIPGTTILSSAVNGNFSDIATGLGNCLTRDGQAGMTAAFKAIAGTAGAPSITFTSDTASGMYLVSAGNLGLTANGALALELNQFQVAQFQQVAEAKAFVIVDTANSTTSSNINTLATAGTGAITVGTASSWATAGYAITGNEILAYVSGTAAGIDVVARGVMGTTSVSHATGSAIVPLLSGLGRSELLVPSRATASRPSNPGAGNFGYNSGSGGLEFYNGTSWVTTSQPNIEPQGYLSPTAGIPIITGDATSQTTVYYNPYKGNTIPVPTNGVFNLQTFATSAIALSASQTTAGIYDIYGFISTTNSTLTFGISPSWAAGSSGSVTAGSCARGTGAGGTEITRVGGVWTNTTTMTILNGASSYSIATASGILLGSIYIGATAGTVNLHRAWGQNRQWGIWNYFNRVPVYLRGGDSTATWQSVTTAGAYRPSNASTANNLTIFSGLADDYYDLNFGQYIVTGNGSQTPNIGIGINSTSSVTGKVGQGLLNGSIAVSSELKAEYQSAPLLGINVITALETGNVTGNATYSGTEAHMVLSAKWRA